MERSRRRSARTDWVGIVSFGFFLMLVGTIWLLTPNMFDRLSDFVRDFGLQNVSGSIALPAPRNVYSHTVVYTALMQSCIAFAIFQVFVLFLRLVLHDSIGKVGDAVSGIAFWFSAGYFTSLLASASIGWFGFLAGIVISGGLAIVASSLVKLLR